jgi:hypothetical protein
LPKKNTPLLIYKSHPQHNPNLNLLEQPHQPLNMSSGRFPLPSEGVKGGKDSKTATATCFCGAVQCLFVS